MNHSAKYFFIIIFVAIVFLSCKKKVVEIVPVIDYENISLPENSQLTYFSFPTLEVGYAGTDSLFKTTDGGKTWKSLGLNGHIDGLEFLDENNGFCARGGSLNKTSDGGHTWNFAGAADAIGKTKDGKLIVCHVLFNGANISMSQDTGRSFNLIGEIYFDGMFQSMHVTDDAVFVLDDKSYSRDVLYGVRLAGSVTPKVKFDVIASENPNDIYFTSNAEVLVGPRGYIAEGNQSLTRQHYGHAYTYNSVDGNGKIVVAVGFHTMTTNMKTGMDEKWNEVFDSSGNGFEHVFNRIRFFNERTFFVSGNGGLLWKATI